MGQKNLPAAAAAEHVKAFERLGYSVARRIDHSVIMTKPGSRCAPSIPTGNDQVSKTVLNRMLNDCGISEREYLDAFHERGAHSRKKQRRN